MGKLLLTIGEPGTGKSRAIKNLDPETTMIIKPNYKDLPFEGGRELWNTEKGNVFYTRDFLELKAVLDKINKGTKFKVVVIEDISHFFSERVMKEAAIKGYDKWNMLAADTYKGLLSLENELREDLYVILIGHVDFVEDSSGNRSIALLTPGKMLDRYVKISSYVTYVLHTDVKSGDDKIEYSFLTNKDGSGREAKSPEGCLSLFEPNDYNHVIKKIEAYQNKKIK